MDIPSKRAAQFFEHDGQVETLAAPIVGKRHVEPLEQRAAVNVLHYNIPEIAIAEGIQQLDEEGVVQVVVPANVVLDPLTVPVGVTTPVTVTVTDPDTGDGMAAAWADFDADGDFDLAVANEYSGNVSILLNDGDGTFAPAVHKTRINRLASRPSPHCRVIPGRHVGEVNIDTIE